jgi:hypothetical protein
MRPPGNLQSVLAVLAAVLLAGCGETDDGRPRTAAQAGRSVLRPNADSSRATGVSTDTPASSSKVSREPVVAQKPPRSENQGEVILASAAGARDLPPRLPSITDPAQDASRFPGGIIPASPTAEPLPGGPRLLVPERTFRLDGRPRALRVTYDDLDLLRILNLGDPLPPDDVVLDLFPDWLTELDGKTIRLRGFMYPSFEQELSRFILTRDTGACCFGPNPKVYYLIGVTLKEGTTVRYIGDRPFDVVGTFHIQPVYRDGQWYQLYRITDAVVVE